MRTGLSPWGMSGYDPNDFAAGQPTYCATERTGSLRTAGAANRERQQEKSAARRTLILAREEHNEPHYDGGLCLGIGHPHRYRFRSGKVTEGAAARSLAPRLHRLRAR